jgi:hypothetical protein
MLGAWRLLQVLRPGALRLTTSSQAPKPAGQRLRPRRLPCRRGHGFPGRDPSCCTRCCHGGRGCIQDALSLASSMHELSHDSTFSFSAASSEPGDASSQPDLLPTANPFGCLPVDPLPDDVVPPSDSHVHTPDPFHVREIRRRRARTKRAHDAAANIRHSHLRAAKEETNFLDICSRKR